MGDALTVILTAVLSSAVLGTVIQLVFKAIHDGNIERLRAELELERTRFASEQARLSHEIQTRFSTLHVRRAKAMIKIYGLIVQATDAFDYFKRSGARLTSEPGLQERAKAAYDAGLAYQRYYLPRRILFPKAVANRLDELNRLLVAILNEYTFQRVIEKDEWIAFIKASTKFPDTNAALESVESEFRRLYGVEG